MGHRANFVLIRGGEARAYYDQWAALGCAFDFAAGPEHAVAAAEATQPTSELMDWAFAEGGYLLDFDERRAIVFGHGGEMMADELAELGLDDAGEPGEAGEAGAGALELLRSAAPRWAGWLLVWDDRGVDAFAEHLERRGIGTITTRPRSHPSDSGAVSLQA